MNKRDQQVIDFLNMYIIPVSAIVILALLTVFLFIPKYSSVSTNLQSIGTLDENTNILNQNIERLNQASAQNSYIDKAITSYEVIVPTEAKVSEITARLEQIAKDPKYGANFFVSAKAQENVDLNGNKILASADSKLANLPKDISSINMILNVEGTLDKIHEYTNQILNDSRLLTIEKINWTSSDGAKYVAQYELTAYYGEKITSSSTKKLVDDSLLLNPISPVSISLDKKIIDEQTSKVSK